MKSKENFFKRLLNKILKRDNTKLLEEQKDAKKPVEAVIGEDISKQKKDTRVEYTIEPKGKEDTKEYKETEEKAIVHQKTVVKHTIKYKNGDYIIKYIIDDNEVASEESINGVQKKKVQNLGKRIVRDKDEKGNTIGFGRYERAEELDSFVERVSNEIIKGETRTIAKAPLLNYRREKIGEYSTEEISRVENGEVVEFYKNTKNAIAISYANVAKIEEETLEKNGNRRTTRYLNDKKVFEMEKLDDKTTIKEYQNGSISKIYVYDKYGKVCTQGNEYNGLKQVPLEGQEGYEEFTRQIESAGIPERIILELKKAKKYIPKEINEIIKQANRQIEEKKQEQEREI